MIPSYLFFLSQVKDARAALAAFLRRHQRSDRDSYQKIMHHLLNLYEDETQASRLFLPVVHTYEFLVSSGFLDFLQDDGDQGNSHIKRILNTTWKGIRTSNPAKKMAGITLFCHTLRFPQVSKYCLAYLMSLICSPLPRIRLYVADNLQVSVLTFSDHLFDSFDGEEAVEDTTVACDEVLHLLAETDWNQPVSELKAIRQRLCSLFGIKSSFS